MEILTVAILVIIGGLTGGLVDLFNRFEFTAKHNRICFQGHPITWKHFWKLLIVHGYLGIGGAIAMQFLLISIGKFQGNADIVEQIVFLFSMSVVAGFASRRIMQIATSELEKQISATNKKAEEAQKASEQAQNTSKEAIADAERNELILQAFFPLREGSPQSEKILAVQKLSHYLEANQNYRDRAAVILLGRLYRALGRYEMAIEVLDKFINSKMINGEKDKDYADALYNRACYKVLLDVKLRQTPNRQGALDDLRESIRISNENAIDAQSDEDFQSICQEEEFCKIVGVEASEIDASD